MKLSAIASLLPIHAAIKGLRAWMVVKNTLQFGDPFFFQQVFIEISRHCNRSCSYCPNVSIKQPEWFMDYKQFYKILDRLRELNWKGPVAYHFLNEPLMHPELVTFIRMTKFYLPKCMPILYVNGDFLTMELAQRLVSAGLQRCSITDHAPTKPGYYDRINPICKRFPSVFRFRKLTSKDIFKTGNSTKVKSRPNKECHAPERAFIIRWNGDYGLCCCDAKNEHTFGNISTHSVMEAWNSLKWTNVRNRLQDGFRDFEICKDCDGVA